MRKELLVMYLAGVIPNAVNAYPGVAYEIYVSGCTRNCPECHGKELQDFKYGKPLDISKLIKDMKVQKQWFDIIGILGGDLLCQNTMEAIRLVAMLKAQFPRKKMYLFTGAELADVPLWAREFFDVIKVGPYVIELAQEGYPSSSNQKVLVRGVDY
jgi:anaerobic ribonucleoside-triphosphate reductase activating protein